MGSEMCIRDRYRGGAAGNENFGYICGGYIDGNALSVVDRIDYSNDTATASPKGDLSIPRKRTAATGNANFGYVGGGQSEILGSNRSSIDRVDYANDTATAVEKGPLSSARQFLAATGNASFGYFGGGYVSAVISTVDRVDYSNDTATAITKGPLTSAKSQLSAVSAAENALPQ